MLENLSRMFETLVRSHAQQIKKRTFLPTVKCYAKCSGLASGFRENVVTKVILVMSV